MRRLCGFLLACALLGACSKRDPVADGANNVAGLPVSSAATPSPDGSPPANLAQPANQAEATGSARIPAALQGRWGLTPRDCTSALGDAKGLLVVNEGELRFYESRAVPASDIQSNADSISGNFDFTGEGQSWSKYVALDLRGRDLVRTETHPNASFTYAKCT